MTNWRALKSIPPISLPDRRHDDVVDERLNDGAEGGAEDDTDSHVDEIAFKGELFECLKYSINTWGLTLSTDQHNLSTCPYETSSE